MPSNEQIADASSLPRDVGGVNAVHLAAGSNPIDARDTMHSSLVTKGVNEPMQDMHKVSTSEEKTGNDMSKQAT